MSNASIVEFIKSALSEVADIEANEIRGDSDILGDLGVDSLDFLDITYELDRKYNIKLPVEKWVEEVSKGEREAKDFLVVENLAQRISELVEARSL